MRKRFLSFMLAFSILATLFGSLPITVSAATSGSCGSNLTWKLDDKGTLTISGTGAMKNWSSYSSVPWCSSMSSIKTVVLSSGVTLIGDHAFEYCYNLTSITIPNSVTSIGDYAFDSCHILTSITIPDSVTSIGDYAFEYCTNLTSITIPDSVTYIGRAAFFYCSMLNDINVDENNTNYSSIDGNLFTKDKSTLIQYAIGKTKTSYVVPDSVTSINDYAFAHCHILTSITIPNSVTSIGDRAFNGCVYLASITIPNSVTSIGDYAFDSCHILTSITIPDSVTSIGDYAFEYCPNLTSITIPNSVTSIGDYVFAYCETLASITIPNSVNSIDSYAFYYCKSLSDVYYTGGESEWNNISIGGSGNTYLTNATIHYNYKTETDDDSNVTNNNFQVDIYRANYLINFDIGSVMEKEYFNFDTPSKTIVDTGKSNGLSTMIDAWNLVTGTVDTMDDPTKLEDYVCEQKDIYEAILLDLLESSVDSDVLAIANNDVVKNSKKIADTVMNDMKNKYYYDNISDFTNICTLDDDSIRAIKEIVTDCFKEEHSQINKISKISQVIGQTIEYATDLVDYCEKLTAFCNMLEISESMQVIVQEMNKECPLDNPALKSALLELNHVLNASEDEFINKMVGEFFGAAGLNMANYFFDKMWDNVKTKFMVMNPEAYVLLAAYKTGKLMSNLAFNTDTIAEKYYKLAAVNEVENLLQDVYYRIKSIYLNDKNSKNAQNYNSMVDFMFKMLDADCEYSVKYLQETDSTLVAKIKDVFGNNDIDDAIEYVEQLQNRYGYYREKVDTDWILSLSENYPSIFVEYVSVLKDSLKKQKEYLVACPVDVYIYDKDGNLVGSVIDNVPSCESDVELTIYVSGDKKTIYTYGEEYDMIYVGNDTGTMDITITEYDEMKSTARSVNFNNIVLTDGLTYTSSENGTTLTENAYVLMDETEKCIEPDYDSLTAMETETHIAEITRGYFTDTMDVSRQLNYGQNVEITAYIPEGYEFVGWTSNSSEDIFEDAGSITTKITMPDYDVNIIANIIKCPTLSITELTESNLKFKAINCENITAGVVILAIYNEDGSLNYVKTEDFAKEINFTDLNLTSGKAKVMLWDNLNNLIPLTKATEKMFYFTTTETE